MHWCNVPVTIETAPSFFFNLILLPGCQLLGWTSWKSWTSFTQEQTRSTPLVPPLCIWEGSIWTATDSHLLHGLRWRLSGWNSHWNSLVNNSFFFSKWKSFFFYHTPVNFPCKASFDMCSIIWEKINADLYPKFVNNCQGIKEHIARLWTICIGR